MSYKAKSGAKLTTIILAAGISKRMFAKTPKILLKILGKPIIRFVVELAEGVGADEIVMVTGKDNKELKRLFPRKIKYISQERPLGTADATKIGLSLASYDNILILYGDVPLLNKNRIIEMIDHHHCQRADLTILTCEVNDPTGYGRIIRNRTGKVIGIVEDVDTTDVQKKIREINAGIYLGTRDLLHKFLQKITPQNQQKEFYLTDIVKYLINNGKTVVGFKIENEEEIMGINNRWELARAREIVKQRWFEELMRRGVAIEDPLTTSIDLTAEIGNFVHIRPFTIIEGNTKIEDNETIGPFVWIKDGVKVAIK